MKTNGKRIVTTWLLIFTSLAAFAQDKEIGIELQLYPTGFIGTINYDTNFGEKNNVVFRAGVNIFDHRDLGVQDKETGNGFGFGVGYKRYFGEGFKAWRLGIKTDYWRNKVDWTNSVGNPNETNGETKISVLQPTAELSYVFRKNTFAITPSASLGYEWNVSTNGEPTGEGAILLLGIQISKQL